MTSLINSNKPYVSARRIHERTSETEEEEEEEEGVTQSLDIKNQDMNNDEEAQSVVFTDHCSLCVFIVSEQKLIHVSSVLSDFSTFPPAEGAKSQQVILSGVSALTSWIPTRWDIQNSWVLHPQIITIHKTCKFCFWGEK